MIMTDTISIFAIILSVLSIAVSIFTMFLGGEVNTRLTNRLDNINADLSKEINDVLYRTSLDIRDTNRNIRDVDKQLYELQVNLTNKPLWTGNCTTTPELAKEFPKDRPW
jgi:hypothetical protein